MTPRAPKTITTSITEAYEHAKAESTPVFAPVPHYADDRGWSLMNLLQGALGPEGQINCSVMYPGVIKAWHRHERQTDFWIVLHGHLKAGVHRETDDASWMIVMGEKRPGTLIIPPGLWHGAATVGPDPATLLYYVTRQYDPASPDEERRPYDALPGFPWSIEHR